MPRQLGAVLAGRRPVTLGLNGLMRGVDEIADELYRLPPAEFTAARDAQVAQARAEGDRATAAALAALKRPTVGAWLVNLLALRRPDVVGEILELGDQIRDAQAGGATGPPAQIRDLSAHRRRLLDAAVLAGRSLAASAGSGEPTPAQLTEAEATLAAAMADEEAARLVRSGRVVKALSYAGFGGGFGAAVPVRSSTQRTSGTRAAPDAPAAQQRQTRPEAQAQRPSAERAQAAQRLARAEAALSDARAAESGAVDEAARLTEQIAALRESLEQVQIRARAARQTRLAAEREVESAQRRLARLGDGSM